MRKCKKCGKRKPLPAFESTNKERGWRRHTCKVCRVAYFTGWAAESRAHLQEYRREYHKKNRKEIILRVNKWVKANRSKRRKNALAYYYRLQDQAIMAYGGYVCNWCGITEPLVLCIDHVNNDGKKHREELGALGGHKFYKWLKDREYPKGFQVLCMNCNHAKYRNGGVLPQSLNGRCND